jgi:rhodanese-related sulfurtransferase
MHVEQLLSQRDDVLLIDVRHPHEWEAGRIEGSTHVPLDELPGRLDDGGWERPVVTVCRGGPRSAEAAELLRAHGIQADHLEGGIVAWAELGLPVVAPDGQPGSVAPAAHPEVKPSDGSLPHRRREGGPIALATASMRDLELAATMAATAEDLGYSSIWVAGEPTGNGVAVAAAMLRATTAIRVGIGPIACDPGRAKGIAAQLAASELVPRRTALAIEADAAAWNERSLRLAFATFRDVLGREYALGVSALGADTCRLGGELADLVFLDWMSPERIAWARGHIEKGGESRPDGGGRGPQVVGCIRVAFGAGAGLRLSGQAVPYQSKPHYASSFAAMGSAAVGVAAVDPSQARMFTEPFRALLDETVIRPVATLPTSESPALGEVFEPLSVILEVAHSFAPAPGSRPPAVRIRSG